MSIREALPAITGLMLLAGAGAAIAAELPGGAALVRDGVSADGRTVTVLSPPVGRSCWGIKQYQGQSGRWSLLADLLAPARTTAGDCPPVVATASGDGATVAVLTTWDGRIDILERRQGRLAASHAIELSEKAGHDYPAPSPSIALSGDGRLLLLGAENRDCFAALPKDACGVAALWRREAAGWRQILRIRRPEDAGIGQRFGETVAMSADGKVLLVGGRGLFEQFGSLYAYVAEDDGNYALVDAIRPAEPDSEFAVDASLDSDGSTLAVGGAQRVYLYTRTADDTWKPGPIAETSDSRAGSFGSAVALSANGRTLLVGAPRSLCINGASTRCGLAYRFPLIRSGESLALGAGRMVESPVPAASTDFGWRVASGRDGSVWAAQGRLTHVMAP